TFAYDPPKRIASNEHRETEEKRQKWRKLTRIKSENGSIVVSRGRAGRKAEEQQCCAIFGLLHSEVGLIVRKGVKIAAKSKESLQCGLRMAQSSVSALNFVAELSSGGKGEFTIPN
ncbi:unnamed protein product, partial [Anisakis simplex]|uniref:RNase H domain-containing protein n=1 Tax=Anisakis simplex TaxID=6269 RepID=A0A0M3KAQ3_ANISI